MGDAQARMLEQAFSLPSGWFDTDPDTKPDLISREPTGKILVLELNRLGQPSVAEEDCATYDAGWPFKNVSKAAVAGLNDERRQTLERIMLAYLDPSAVSTDWLNTALKMAADLDRRSEGENFTFFVRAIQEELKRVKQPNQTDADHAKR